MITRIYFLDNCPNKIIALASWSVTRNGTMPAAGTPAYDKVIAEVLDKADAEFLPQAKCDTHKCLEGDCVYDSEIVGTPKLVQIPAGKTHKHKFNTPPQYTVSFDIRFGCWCEKAD